MTIRSPRRFISARSVSGSLPGGVGSGGHSRAPSRMTLSMRRVEPTRMAAARTSRSSQPGRLDVVELDTARARAHEQRAGDRVGVRAAAVCLAAGRERAGRLERRLALLRREVDVARAEREAVGVANRRHARVSRARGRGRAPCARRRPPAGRPSGRSRRGRGGRSSKSLRQMVATAAEVARPGRALHAVATRARPRPTSGTPPDTSPRRRGRRRGRRRYRQRPRRLRRGRAGTSRDPRLRRTGSG